VNNRLNGMKYVGITSRSLQRRWAEQVNAAEAGRGWALHVAIRRFGASAFDVSVLETASCWEALCRREREVIADLGSLVPHGYNITNGGEGAPGRVTSAETKAKLSAAKLGKPLSLEHRAKLAAAKRGKRMPPRSAAHCQKISSGLRAAWLRRKAASE
jgi:group I intron endonuclease